MTIRRLESGDFLVRVDCDLRSLGEKRMFVATDADGNPKCPEGVPIIVRFGRAQKLLKGILEGTYYSQSHAGESISVSSAQASRLVRMSFLSPYIVEKLISGKLNVQRVWSQIDKLIAIPYWSEQHRFLGIE